jgi:hypothetical protein
VVAGDAATGQSLATGDVVNTAARLEQAAGSGEILIGSETYRLVRHAVTAEPAAPLSLKGKAEPVPAWRLAAVDMTAGGQARRMDSPMVGRDRQLRVLLDVAERSREERAPQLVTVLGLAGVGKSRLVHEFLGQVRKDATVIRGRCLSYGDAITYWPLSEALRPAAGIEAADSPIEAVERLAVLAAGVPQAKAVAERVAGAIGLAADAAPPGGGQETFWAIRRLFEGMARKQPLVAVFDDVQWATPTFLDLLEHITDWSRDAPILLLAIARPELVEARPTWGGGKMNATSLLLEPLDDSAVGEIVANLVGRQPLPAELARRIAEAAEGNPLFVEELLSMLVDDGILEREGDAFRVTRTPSEIPVPPTVELLLAARLDRLPREERAVLERAAVVGKRFGASEVAQLSPEAERSASLPRLMALVRKEFLRLDEQDPPDLDSLDEEVRFRFRHQLVRDAAYESLPKQERAHLHEAFADWMESTLSARMDELDEVVGYHLEQASTYRRSVRGEDSSGQDLALRAATHLRAGARRAEAVGDTSAVIRLLERTRSLLPAGHAHRSEGLPMLARAYVDAARLPEARAAINEVLEDPQAPPATRAEALELTLLWFSEGHGAAEVRPLTDEALRIRRKLGEPAGLARAFDAASQVEWFLGNLARARDLAEEGLRYARDAGDIGLQAELLMARAIAALLSRSTSIGEGLPLLEEQLDFARQHGLLAAEAMALQGMGMQQGHMGNRERAQRLIDQGRAIQADLGVRMQELAFHGDALLDYWAGDLDSAVNRLRDAYQGLLELGERGYLSTVATDLAQALIDRDELDEADEMLNTAAQTGAEDDVVTQIELKASRARLLARRGSLAQAEALAREAVAEAEASEYFLLFQFAHMALADVLRLAGRIAEAAGEYRAVIAHETARGNRLFLPRLQKELEALERGSQPA